MQINLLTTQYNEQSDRLKSEIKQLWWFDSSSLKPRVTLAKSLLLKFGYVGLVFDGPRWKWVL